MLKKIIVFENQKLSNCLGEAIMTSSYSTWRWSNSLLVSHKMPEKTSYTEENGFLFVTNIFIYGINYVIFHLIYILIQIWGFLSIFKGFWPQICLVDIIFMDLWVFLWSYHIGFIHELVMADFGQSFRH